MNRFLKNSLTALTVCIAAMTAMAQDSPLNSLPVKTVNGKSYHYYVVQPKETIYSLSHKLGIDKQTIERHNPSVKDGLRVHETLYFPVAAETVTMGSHATEQQPTTTHKAKKGESAYAIAHKYGVTVPELVEANPGIVDGVKANDIITIPSDSTSTVATNSATISTPADSEQYVTEEPALIDSLFDEQEPMAPAAINIAVMLPLQTDRDKPSKQALHYTDFVKGMLMAVDTMRHVEIPIHMSVYDTHENQDSVKAILSRMNTAGTGIIIAPEDSLQIELIAGCMDSTDTKVLNMFAVRNDSHEQHLSLIQGNIPHEMMYDMAVKNFMTNFKDYIPIIVRNSAEEADKSKFIDMLTAELTAANKEYRAITHNGNLDETQLEWMSPDARYVFVPASASRVVLNSILPAILSKKRAAVSSDDVVLFGYPEWIIIRGDLQQKLHEAGTTIYSRFVMNPDNYRSRTLDNNFRQWYGSDMIPTAPMYGTLGYDTGLWIINSVTKPETASHYTGIQNGFNIGRCDSGQGYVNRSLFFINFMPNGLIESTNCD